MKQFITCALLFIVLTQVCLGSNLLVNGDFKDTPLNGRWELVDSLPGWTAQGGLKMERGFGDVYNANWGNAEIVMELDGNQNYKMSQSVQLKPGHYVLGFRWARRSGSTKTSAMDILWNDKKIFSVAADDKDDSVHHQNILILVRQPKKTHKLSIVGAAASDGLGMTVAHFWLDRRKQSFCNHQKNPAEKNFIVNGDLKTTPLTNTGGW